MSESQDPFGRPSWWRQLYYGGTRIDFVGRWRWYLGVALVLVAVSVGSLAIRGLNRGIEFEGGVAWEIPAGDASVADARDAVAPYGLGGATIQTLESDGVEMLRVAAEEVDDNQPVTAALEELTGEQMESVQDVGPSWGREITEKARDALVIFLVLVSAYIALRFRLKSALPVLAALAHDVLITVGVYSLFQWAVTPATVIAFLTILGYSLYDTVVVFDKVEENNHLVRATGNLTYAAMVNMSLNQTLMRSLNTTLTSVLPVASLLVIGAGLMGAASLRDFGLALFVGMMAGTYSSFFVASPLLVLLRSREPLHRTLREKVKAEGRSPTAVPERILATTSTRGGTARQVAAVTSKPESEDSKGRATTVTPSGRVITARPRKKTRKARR